MAAEFEEGLTRLPDVENADETGVGGKGGEEVGVVGGCGEAEEWGSVGHGLLGFGGGHATSWRASVRVFSGLLLRRFVDDGAVFQTPQIEHPDATIGTTADEHVYAASTEPDIEDFLVVGNQLGFGC